MEQRVTNNAQPELHQRTGMKNKDKKQENLAVLDVVTFTWQMIMNCCKAKTTTSTSEACCALLLSLRIPPLYGALTTDRRILQFQINPASDCVHLNIHGPTVESLDLDLCVQCACLCMHAVRAVPFVLPPFLSWPLTWAGGAGRYASVRTTYIGVHCTVARSLQQQTTPTQPNTTTKRPRS